MCKMDDRISKTEVIEILDDMMKIAEANWNSDEVLKDMIVTIKDKVNAIQSQPNH